MRTVLVFLDWPGRPLRSDDPRGTYKIAVGRSRSVTGPYIDRLGTPLHHGGGTVILSEAGTMFGPGGQSVVGDRLLVHHFYDGTANGDFRLAIRTIRWEHDWPVLVGHD
jgi:arabinan endo-1,5-alpha-L-arabinosidase